MGALYEEHLGGVVWPKTLRHLTVPDPECGIIPDDCHVNIIHDPFDEIIDLELDYSGMMSHIWLSGLLHPELDLGLNESDHIDYMDDYELPWTWEWGHSDDE